MTLEARRVALTRPALLRAAREVAQLATGSVVTAVEVGENPSRLQLRLPVPGALPDRVAFALRDFIGRFDVAVRLVDPDGAAYRVVEDLVVDEPVPGEWSGYVFSAPGVALAMPWGIRGRARARLEPDGSVTLYDALWRVEQRGTRPLAVREASRVAGGAVVGAAAPDARSRDGALALLRARYAQAAIGASPAVQKALGEAVARVEQGATGGYDVYRRAFDEAVNLSAIPEAMPLVEPLAQWADDRVGKQLALGPWPKTPPAWSSTGFDPLAPVELRPPVSWFPRNAAWFLTLAGNPDVVRDPSLRPVLAGIAREALTSRWANDPSAFTPATVGNFYEWIIRQRLPARAPDTIRWMGLGAKTAGYEPPTLWEGIKEIAERTKEDLTPPEVPGGYGVYIGLGIVAAAAVAAWRIIPKSP